MKRNFITVSLLSLFALGSVSLQAQDNVITKKVNNSQQPTLIVFKEGTETYQKANGAKFLAKHLALNPKAEYRLIQSESDKYGFTHDKYQLYYDGVKVEGSTYSIHAKNGAISSMSGNYAKIEQLSITPTLNENTAYQIAFHKANATLLAEGKEAVNPNKNSTGELVILNINDVNYLAYKFDIYGYSKGITRKFYYVDAHTGSILREDSRIKHSTDMNYGTREKK